MLQGDPQQDVSEDEIKLSFDDYLLVTEREIEKFKIPIQRCLQTQGFFPTFYMLDYFFEQYSENPQRLYYFFYSHTKCLYAAIQEKILSLIDQQQQDSSLSTAATSASEDSSIPTLSEYQVNLERIKQFLTFMYRADIECKSTSDIFRKLKKQAGIQSFASDEDVTQFVFENGAAFDQERNKFKQVMLDTVQYYNVDHVSKNYRFDFEILLGFFRLMFQRHDYLAPPRSDPNLAAQDALGETDLYSELLMECGIHNH